VPAVVQGDPPQVSPPEQAAEFVGVPLRVHRHADLVGDHLLAVGVPVECGEPGLIHHARCRALLHLKLAQDDQGGD
jgi:hypothetical protein